MAMVLDLFSMFHNQKITEQTSDVIQNKQHVVSCLQFFFFFFPLALRDMSCSTRGRNFMESKDDWHDIYLKL